MSKTIMIQGTMSGVGKSIITAGLCRIFHEDGFRVSPFKAQNMALNSFVTNGGLELGRAQAMQAEAAGVEPDCLMNPILLKSASDNLSLLVVKGVGVGYVSAKEYYQYKDRLLPIVKKSFNELSAKNDIIVIEGAGSPVEINLKENDIVNMKMAEIADAPVILVGDIERGGVFAQVFGTIMLLEKSERERVKGFVINKFRGDESILLPGIKTLEDMVSVKSLGVLPYMKVDVDEEDSMSFSLALQNGYKGYNEVKASSPLEIAIIKLPHISNFTDFAVFDSAYSTCVHARYVDSAGDIKGADAIILPGTKSTIYDMKWLKSSGIAKRIIEEAKRGVVVFGICGGYQMLGEAIEDPLFVEGGSSEEALNLIPIKTVFKREKTLRRVSGKIENIEGILKGIKGLYVEGYEIHNGQSCFDNGRENTIFDIASSGNVYGTYIHGFFDSKDILVSFLLSLSKKKGVNIDTSKIKSRKEIKEHEYRKLSKSIRCSLDIESIYKICGLK